MLKLFLLHPHITHPPSLLPFPHLSFPIQPLIKTPPKPLTRIIKPQLPIQLIINLRDIALAQLPLSLDRIQILQDPAFRLRLGYHAAALLDSPG